jgi:hypothetical protein
MFWYDLKVKNKIWQNICIFKNFYLFQFDCKKTYDILGQV